MIQAFHLRQSHHTISLNSSSPTSLEELHRQIHAEVTPFSRTNPGFGRLDETGRARNWPIPGGGHEGLSRDMLISRLSCCLGVDPPSPSGHRPT